jgi:ectoine hydroxylase-related dioxygenase (phytanoyl-CoA dioxygenase family)
MAVLSHQQENILHQGFAIFDDIYSDEELEKIIEAVDQSDQSGATFRKTADLFAIRQFLKEIPKVKPLIFNQKLKSLISELFDGGYFVVKSIYFDKPEKSNWFVAWHQDLTISVDKRIEMSGYSSWTVKQNQFAVQPPLGILNNNFTIRIHLDDTDESNGALKVVPGSHINGVQRAENIDWDIETDQVCEVKRGAIMIMRPLLMHASNRTISDKKRRVIHIEFSKAELATGIDWAEKMEF